MGGVGEEPVRDLRILVVDDAEDIQTILSDRLRMHGYEVLNAFDGEEALKKVEAEVPDLVLLDILLPKLGGMEVLNRIKSEHPETPVIMITAHMTVERAVEAMLEQGAYDFFEKPLNLDLLMVKINKALERQALVRESEYLRSELKGEYSQIIGKSQEIIDVLKRTERIAPFDHSVLITGETGTGKELIARAVHLGGQRAKGPFIPVNCSAIPRELAEDQFFGHVRGAYTGANTDYEGYFGQANGGTLFLDEIGDMPLELQPKLLRAVQEKEFMKVGGKAPVKVDVRFIVATNQDLEKAVENGRFREDLFYRLRDLKIAIPPLRERKEDIPLLIRYFLRNAALNRRDVQITDEAMELLMDYHWPGNVRELQGCIVSTIVLADSNTIRPEDLPPEVKSSESSHTGAIINPITLKAMEKAHILKILEEVGGNRTEAAKRLGISLRTLQYRLKEYEDEG